ncbi:MAG: hypothetical protein EWV83_20800 [Microcystis sp. M_OC_Ca_00000000_S217Cul]|uniref:hypothetical protein n=1 Tax=unclassified Microcystis TaxID=2643300 RepID=UPI0011966B60|nr:MULTISPECIES: hypothetical protein [unclassified Microcystis]TRT71825.1 MAG: hypothetical protein EWV83_20800 [Microcystis sp. M_OC_Ca_00000000_S217Cul]TRT83498.1 MAG: hypothetical protein EWV66_22665 [Microcystis sp. M_OC_Ca_00000000_C217Col]
MTIVAIDLEAAVPRQIRVLAKPQDKLIIDRANTVGRTEIQALGQTTHCLLSESLVDKVTG